MQGKRERGRSKKGGECEGRSQGEEAIGGERV